MEDEEIEDVETVEVSAFELAIDEKLEASITAKAEELRKTKKLAKVFPFAIGGDEFDEKEVYVIYLKEPNFKDFSKFQSIGKTNETQALRQLAKDCYLDGDRELLDDDSLFMFGLMPQVMSIVRFRKSKIINLSKAGK